MLSLPIIKLLFKYFIVYKVNYSQAYTIFKLTIYNIKIKIFNNKNNKKDKY